MKKEDAESALRKAHELLEEATTTMDYVEDKIRAVVSDAASAVGKVDFARRLIEDVLEDFDGNPET